MKNTVNDIVTIEKLESENKQLKQKVIELEVTVNWFMEKFRLNQQKRFGVSSEQVNVNQLSLFNEAETETKPTAPEPVLEEITYKRHKQAGHKEDMLKDMPVETIDYTLNEEEKVCPICGDKLHNMSTQTRKEFNIIPPQVKVIEHVQHIYSCRKCEKEGINTPVVKASMPKPVIPGSLASPSAIAFVMEQKFVESLPLYRQEQHFHSLGVNLSRQTLSNWMIKSTENWLSLLYDRLHMYLVENDIICADETPLQVLHEPDRPAESKSYMWLYRTGKYGSPIILYDYQETRHGKHPKKFLENFSGFLQVDGYDGYNAVLNATLVGCWAHARRKLFEAIKALPSEVKDKNTVAHEGLNFCNHLYKIEHELNAMNDMTPELRYELRLEKCIPILDSFYAWLKYQRPRVIPKRTLGIAIVYCLNQWEQLKGFLKDGRLEIDNNRSERSIKPFVIGRKNWLFSNTPNGANSSAIIYSIVETAKENSLNVFAYLKYLLEKLPNIDIKDPKVLDSLLPWSDSLPEYCKISN